LTSDARPATRIGGRAFQFEPHRCFACGELNEHGLRLVLHADETGCRTELVLDPRFEGWDGVAHGGILCTILDEVMAWAVIGRDVWGVTARMTVDFRRPVFVGRALRAEGTVVEAGRRLFRTEGRIFDASTGEVLASSSGTYVAAPPERLAELKARYRIRPLEDDPAVDATDTPGSVAE
jgi:uncharacterized protein (TIGR00369 family)